MSLNAAALMRIEALLSPADAEPSSLGDLRREFPGLSLTRCDVSDLGVEQPFRQYRRFNLYLVDGGDHCWQLTADPARATGLVIAAKP